MFKYQIVWLYAKIATPPPLSSNLWNEGEGG